MDAAEDDVLHYEFKADLNAYLENGSAPVASLAELIQFNNDNVDTVVPFFAQERMEDAEPSCTMSAEY